MQNPGEDHEEVKKEERKEEMILLTAFRYNAHELP